jgi:hypothetical protein
MKYGFLAPLVALAAGAGLARGQEGYPTPEASFPLGFGSAVAPAGYNPSYPGPGGPPAPPSPYASSVVPTAPTVSGEMADAVGDHADADDGLRFWNLEALVWYVKSMAVPVPLVTGGPAVSLGRIGNPGTTVLIGNENFDNNPYAGARLTAGGWCGCDRLWGWELSGFWLPRRSESHVASNFANDGVLARPFTNALNAQPSALLISFPNFVQGSVEVKSTTEVFGGEANLLARLYDRPCYTLVGSVGFRYFGLDESLTIDSLTFLNDGVIVPFGRFAIRGPATVRVFDSIKTNNQFYGGQVGLQGEVRRGKFFLDVGAKFGAGYVMQAVTYDGESTAFSAARPFLPASQTGGLFATLSNIGTTRRDEFGFLGSGTVKLGYQFTNWLNAYVGYDLIYLSSVVRPGDQIDPVVNPNFVPTSVSFGNTTSVFRPGVPFNRTDFTVQGWTFGTTMSW